LEPLPPKTSPATPTIRTMPYNWGKFQGWVSLIVGVFAFIFLLPAFISGQSLGEKSMGYAIMSPLLLVSGYAFVRRRKYAVLMTYIWMAFYGIIFLGYLLDALTNKALTPYQQGEEIGTGIGTLVVGIVFWSLCSVYYRKRRPEFSAQSGSEASPCSPLKNIFRIDLSGRWYVRVLKVCIALIGGWLLVALLSIVYGFLRGMGAFH